MNATRQNEDIADVLERVAELYDGQNGDGFRVRAYRAAAATLRGLAGDVGQLWSQAGLRGLEELPSIGPGIARAIEELLRTGRLSLLERLQGELGPERALASIPGIGKTLAHRIHEQLHLVTLHDLEAAAHDGRLASVRGFGPRRVRAVREVLASLLRRQRFASGHAAQPPARERPSVDRLLDLDARYREGARSAALPMIAPRRFNPQRTPWLPILHRTEGDLHYTLLFSNTALAHELGTTHDWVVVFYEGPAGDGQCTVVTERRGPLAGKRVVRGREAECERHYRALAAGDRTEAHGADPASMAAAHAESCAVRPLH